MNTRRTLTPAVHESPRHHLLVCVTRHGGERPFASRVLDVRRDYPPLTKELGFRAVAACPHLAGVPWELTVTVRDGALVVECRTEPGQEPLAKLKVSAVALQGLADAMARSHGVEPPYTYLVRVLDRGLHGDFLAWYERTEGADIEDLDVGNLRDRPLRLPRLDGARVGVPAGERRIIAESPSWVRCVFRRNAFEHFLGCAAAETRRERAWAGLGEAWFETGQCAVVIREWIEFPAAEAGPGYLRTTSVAFATLHQQVGRRLVAYAHLHPRMLEGHPIPPRPSGPDTIVAWNFDGAAALPCVFPIALFGAHRAALEKEVSVHAFANGTLQEIQIEVLE